MTGWAAAGRTALRHWRGPAWENHPVASANDPDVTLVHVVICGGTPGEWAAMSAGDWRERFGVISDGVGAVGARWVTLLPHHGAVPDAAALDALGAVLESTGKVETLELPSHRRWIWRRDDGLTVAVDPSPDGHARFAAVVEGLRTSGAAISEETLSAALLQPVENEPDLALVLGPADVVPTSLVWELAYAELVFLDIAWSDLRPLHLELAIADFNRRHRRFGGLDS